MSSAVTHLRVSEPQGGAGELTQEHGQFLFGNSQPPAGASISLTMPVRKAQYAHAMLHPNFQMNFLEGFLREELQNRLAKIVHLDPMMLLALSGGHARWPHQDCIGCVVQELLRHQVGNGPLIKLLGPVPVVID